MGIFILSRFLDIEMQWMPKTNDLEQEWHIGDSTRLPPLWPRFESRLQRHMWVEFVVNSLLCSERFSSRSSSFPLSLKTNQSKLQFDLDRMDTRFKEFLRTLTL